ncbi:hypothetical protein GOP47_0021453 [Adiantum capillus-veneris]|uniref:Uncharacterized protein n=1 Tax=Adiantum capillus-veneris TaxID=13818 RepID=A0A9D4Z7V7_ADICA|nr:hypothetical protein GOP47_0021453 [Adiantum capillus-veneris]
MGTSDIYISPESCEQVIYLPSIYKRRFWFVIQVTPRERCILDDAANIGTTVNKHNDDDKADIEGEELLARPHDKANENDVDEEDQTYIEDEEEDEELEEENDDEDDCFYPYIAAFDELGLRIDRVMDMELADDDVVDD